VEKKRWFAYAIKHFVGLRYNLAAYVVMDDHVHVLVAPSEKLSLQEIIHSWKSFTTNQLQKNFRRIGAIWQREYFDRIVRNERELMEKVNYILTNPARRWPELLDYEWVDCGLPL
jgi:REP element-mobilizing transposase RayT